MRLTNILLALLFSTGIFAQENIPFTRNSQYELHIRQKNGTDIFGIMCKPDGAGRHGVAIISHGFKPAERIQSNQFVKEFLSGR